MLKDSKGKISTQKVQPTTHLFGPGVDSYVIQRGSMKLVR